MSVEADFDIYKKTTTGVKMKKIITIIGLGIFLLGGRVMAMDHSQMDHGSSHTEGTFKEMVMVDGIHAEFQIMELASMDMTDPQGNTHHVMVSFMKDGQKIDKAVGRVKVISPSGKEQISDLQAFGSGVFAANFTIDEAGKWGVICLFKESDGKHTAKFWYQHGMM